MARECASVGASPLPLLSTASAWPVVTNDHFPSEVTATENGRPPIAVVACSTLLRSGADAMPESQPGMAGNGPTGLSAAVPPPLAEPLGSAVAAGAGLGEPVAAAFVRSACVLAISSTRPSPAPVSSVMYGVGVFIGRLPVWSRASSPRTDHPLPIAFPPPEPRAPLSPLCPRRDQLTCPAAC